MLSTLTTNNTHYVMKREREKDAKDTRGDVSKHTNILYPHVMNDDCVFTHTLTCTEGCVWCDQDAEAPPKESAGRARRAQSDSTPLGACDE